jgi:hypothetical protein
MAVMMTNISNWQSGPISFRSQRKAPRPSKQRVDFIAGQLAGVQQRGGNGLNRAPVFVDKFSRPKLHHLDKTPRVRSDVSRGVKGDLHVDVIAAGGARTRRVLRDAPAERNHGPLRCRSDFVLAEDNPCSAEQLLTGVRRDRDGLHQTALSQRDNGVAALVVCDASDIGHRISFQLEYGSWFQVD